MLHWVAYVLVASYLPLAAALVLAAPTLLRRGDGARSKLALQLALVGYTALLVSWLVFVSRFIVLDFTLREVAENTAPGMSLFFRIGASWAGGTGSIYLMTAIMAMLGLAVVVAARGDERSKLKFVAAHALVILFNVIYMLVSGGLDYVKFGAAGLNPLLKSFWLYPHPLATFIAYAFIVTGAIAALAELGASNVLTGFGWAALTLSLWLGGLWSYETLGWGGYWAWDPVETSELLPWVIMTAYMHARGLRGGRSVLYATAASIYFAIFMVRAGLSPLHSFAGTTAANVAMLVPAAIFAILSFTELTPFIYSLSRLLTSRRLQQVALALTIIAFLYMHVVLFASLAVPAAVHLMGKPASIPQGAAGVRFYHPLLFPAFLLVLALIPACIGAISSWRVYAGLLAGTGVLAAYLARMVATGALTWSPLSLEMTNMMISIALPFAAVAAAASLVAIARYLARRSAPGALLALLHLGLALAAIGILVSGPYAFNQGYSVQAFLQPGGVVTAPAGVTVKMLWHRHVMETGSWIYSSAFSGTLPVVAARQLVAMAIHAYLQAESAAKQAAAQLARMHLLGLAKELESNPLVEGEAVITLANATIKANITGRLHVVMVEGGQLIPVIVGNLTTSRSAAQILFNASRSLSYTVRSVRLAADNITIIGSLAQLHLFNILSPPGSHPQIAGLYNGSSGSAVVGPVSLVVLEGNLTYDGRSFKLPLSIEPLSAYLMPAQLTLLREYLSIGGNVSKLLHSAMELLASPIPSVTSVLPPKLPSGSRLLAGLLVETPWGSRRATVSIRYEANGELAGIHGLVPSVVTVRIGLDDVYFALNPPNVPNQYAWNDLLVYYLNHTLAEAHGLQRIGLVTAFAAGYLIDEIRHGAQPTQLMAAALNLYKSATNYQDLVKLEGIEMMVKLVPMVWLLWIGIAIMVATEVVLTAVLALRLRGGPQGARHTALG